MGVNKSFYPRYYSKVLEWVKDQVKKQRLGINKPNPDIVDLHLALRAFDMFKDNENSCYTPIMIKRLEFKIKSLIKAINNCNVKAKGNLINVLKEEGTEKYIITSNKELIITQ
jgi:hypothetical protein